MKSLRTFSSAAFLVLALLGAYVSTGTASAQDSEGRSSSWDNLKTPTPGQEIRVEMNNFSSYEGQFQSLSDDGITLRQKGHERTLVRKDVFRVAQKMGPDHFTRNALVGMALGTGAGLVTGSVANHVIWSHVNCDEGPECAGPPNPHWRGILTPLGGVGGFAIGAAVPTHAWRDLYRAGQSPQTSSQ